MFGHRRKPELIYLWPFRRSERHGDSWRKAFSTIGIVVRNGAAAFSRPSIVCDTDVLPPCTRWSARFFFLQCPASLTKSGSAAPAAAVVVVVSTLFSGLTLVFCSGFFSFQLNYTVLNTDNHTRALTQRRRIAYQTEGK